MAFHLSSSFSSSSTSSLLRTTPSLFSRRFQTSSLLNAKSPPGRGKDALRKARRQTILDQRKLSRNSDAIITGQVKPTLTHKQREEKRLMEIKKMEMKLEDAGKVLRAHSISRPNQSYELHIVTSVSSHQSNALRGRLSLPKDPRTKGEHIILFAEEGSETFNRVLEVCKNLGIEVNGVSSGEEVISSSTEASAGASESENPVEKKLGTTTLTLGGLSLISQIQSNRIDSFTKVLSTNTLLPNVSKSLARSLGPRGLMPSLKRNTVILSDSNLNQVENSINEAKGSTDWRGDRNSVVRLKVGRLDFENEELKRNVKAVVEAVVGRVGEGLGGNSKATGGGGGGGGGGKDGRKDKKMEKDDEEGRWDEKVEGGSRRSAGQMKKARTIIKQVHLSSTQGPGIRLDLDELLA